MFAEERSCQTIVSTREPTPFQQVFSTRDLYRGAGLRGLMLSAIGSLCLCLLLLVLGYLADLLITRGEVTIPANDLESHAALAELLTGTAADQDPSGPQVLPHSGYSLTRFPFGPGTELNRDAAQPDSATTLTDAGILPTLWRYRKSFWVTPAAMLYARFPALQSNLSALGVLVGLAALLAWVRSMCASRARQHWSSAALAAATRLRKSIHRQALRLGPSDLDGEVSNQALELFTKGVDTVREGILTWLGCYGRDLVRLVMLVVCLLFVDSVFTLVCVVPLLGCWYLIEKQQKKFEDQRKLAESRGERELRVLAEALSKTRLVRGNQMEALEQDHFQRALDRFQESQGGVLRSNAWSRRLVRTLIAGAAAFVALFLGWQVLLPPQQTALASGVVVLAGFLMAWKPLESLTSRTEQLAPAEAAAARIQQFLNAIPEVGQAVGARFLQPLSRMITFEGVGYSTPAHRGLLDGLQLKIAAGRQVALVSTDPLEALAMACLIPRFIEPQQGRILIDGEDIAWVTLDSLRAEVILVGGEDAVLSGTVRENIAGGSSNRSLQEITEAAKIAHAHNFIQRLPQGYETVIGEQGEQLDPGQCYRLGLARAILRKPALLIIEEPSTPLDEDAKVMLDDAYKRIAQDRTVIYLARRLSTLRRCDDIFFLHRGKVNASGSRDRLVQTSPLYRHWEYVNFNEFRHEFETEAE